MINSTSTYYGDTNPVSANRNQVASNSQSVTTQEFLTLFIAQVQNQSPLDPISASENLNQLATFSQVESTEKLVSLTQNNGVLLDNLQVFSQASLIGQSVSVHSNRLHVSQDVEHIEGEIELQAATSQLNVIVKDELGQDVAKLNLGPQSAGPASFSLNLKALGLDEGDYTIHTELGQGQDYQPNIIQHSTVETVKVPSDGSSTLIGVSGIGLVSVFDIAQFGRGI